MGFLAQYFVVGLVYGGLPATTYGVLAVYLNTPGYVYSAAEGMATLPWSFKVFYGMLHDVAPVAGFRRKSYMAIGWAVCGINLLFLASVGLPDPYWCTDANGTYVTACDGVHKNHPACAGRAPAGGANASGSHAVAATPCNAAAADYGGTVAMLMFLACLGYVCADVAADGLTVNYAQLEPLETRGRTQSTVYLFRSMGFICSYVLVGFGMNGRQYGGSFDVGLSFEMICVLFAIPCLLMIPLSWWFVQETKLSTRPALRVYLRGTWALLSSRFFFAVIVFSFVFAGLGSVSTPASVGVQRYWAGVQNLQKQVFRIVSQGIFALGLALTRRYLLNYSWRKLLVITGVALSVVDVLFTWPTVFNLFRNQYFFLGEAFLTELPSAIQFVVTTFVVVEAASKDNGGLVYGLLTTAHNIGLSFARPLANQIFGLFRPSLSDSSNFIEDQPEFRVTVMWSVVLGYGFTFLSFIVLPLLPDQKSEAQERKRTWSSTPRIGWSSVLLLGSTFIYSVTLTFLTMFPSTACLKLVGGEGCS